MSQTFTNKAWFDLVSTTITAGHEIEVRGSKIRELENASITVDPLWPFITFETRNYNIPYCKKELLWKINGDAFDTRIKDHAKMWASVQNDDGSFNSNYGQYWFTNGGVHKAIMQLKIDKYSRRASIPMLNASHINENVRDTVCTEAMTFLIRNDRLNCHVHMRSSDQFFGLCTDIPSFAFVQRLVFGAIQSIYPEIKMGSLTIVAASSHIYERHYMLADKLISKNGQKVIQMKNDHWMPVPSYDEAIFLMNRHGLNLKYENVGGHENYSLCRWLLSEGEL